MFTLQKKKEVGGGREKVGDRRRNKNKVSTRAIPGQTNPLFLSGSDRSVHSGIWNRLGLALLLGQLPSFFFLLSGSDTTLPTSSLPSLSGLTSEFILKL